MSKAEKEREHYRRSGKYLRKARRRYVLQFRKRLLDPLAPLDERNDLLQRVAWGLVKHKLISSGPIAKNPKGAPSHALYSVASQLYHFTLNHGGIPPKARHGWGWHWWCHQHGFNVQQRAFFVPGDINPWWAWVTGGKEKAIA